MKYVQRLQQKHQNDLIDIVLVFLLLTLNYFISFSSVSIVDFEEVNVSWVANYRITAVKFSTITKKNLCRGFAFH